MRWQNTSKGTNDDRPGHATVDGEVDRVGEADEGVDDQDNVLRHLIVQERVETENTMILKKTFTMI